jgi:hypothetical protein
MASTPNTPDSSSGATGQAMPPKTVDVLFELDTDQTTAKISRVYLPGTKDPKDDIANTGRPKGVVKNQTVGSTFEVVVDALGTPGQKCAFNVTNAEPTVLPLTLTKKSNSESVLLTVMG